PEPPPTTMATLPGRGPFFATAARGAWSGRHKWSGCAAMIPASISSTAALPSLMSFCVRLIQSSLVIGGRLEALAPTGQAPLSMSVAPGHRFQGEGADSVGIACCAECLEAGLADLGHHCHCRLEIFPRIEFRRVLGHGLADGSGHCEAVVGVDIDLAHAALDAALDFLHRDTPGWLDIATIGVDDLLQVCRDRG